ncbi:hypothetical protein [Evansella clarkii]|uniref:hypothetical protein n=1 Tax=Evansella clarkii TaxID=79879 RepID=UPI0009969471|nr:hypothetical protein [Evansella clarkii]
MKPIEQKRRMLHAGQDPVLDYVVRFPDGEIGEAATPFYLCDLIFHRDFTDCEDPVTWFILVSGHLKSLALSGAMEEERVIVYDAKGRFFDNSISKQADIEKEELSFVNRDNPVVLDGYDPWTAIGSLIREGYIEVWEKYPTFSEVNKTHGCSNCIFNELKEGVPFCKAWDYTYAQMDWEKPCFWLTNGNKMNGYHYVTPNEIMRDMSHRTAFKPVTERTEHRF